MTYARKSQESPIISEKQSNFHVIALSWANYGDFYDLWKPGLKADMLLILPIMS